MKRILFSILAFALFACNGDDDNNSGNNPNPPLTGNYISVTADGSQTTLQEGTTYQYSISNGGLFGEDYCIYSFGGGLSSFQASSTNHQATISFDNHYVTSECNATEVFATLFETGEFTYGNGNNQGIVVYYAEPGSDHFTSESGSQTGSTFEVTEVTPITTTDIFGTQVSVRVNGNFSCTVYNPENPAENITLENGVFSIVLFPTD